jgi:anaerobic magnesium-protoporphyrin IX monomethyl ester cyclase
MSAPKILFINPSIREGSEAKHVPYGELLVAACAEEWFGADTALLDLNAIRSTLNQKQIDEELIAAVQEEDWDIVGIGGITTTYNSIQRSLKLIRPLTDSLIVLGGGVVTSLPHEVMHWLPEVDLGLVGEAVVTIGEVMEHVYDLNFRDVLGVIWRDQSKLVMNRERPLIEDLDTMPLPHYELAPLDIYFRNSSVLLSEEAMTAKRRLDYAASIGCSLSCNFCFDLGLTGLKQVGNEVWFPRSHPSQVKRLHRWRSPTVCIRDWKLMREKYGCDFISLLDENLMTMEAAHPTHGWIEEISRLCIEAGLQPQCIKDGVPHDPHKCSGLHFGGTSHASLVRPGTLRVMRLMGFTYLDYGYEAWDDRMLKYVRKGATLETNTHSLIMTMRSGIRPIPNNITGFEIEDFESIRRMMVAWQVLGIVVYPFLFTPYPGSDIYYRNKEKILAQYGGDLELFVKTLNDATEPVVSISKNFTMEEILLYRSHMVRGDMDAIDALENVWRKRRGLPPRGKEEQVADWEKFRADVQKLADEAWAEHLEEAEVAELAYRPETAHPHKTGG